MVTSTIHTDYNTNCVEQSVESRNNESEDKSINSIEVYPNPTESLLHCTVPKSNAKTTVIITNVNGVLMIQRNFESNNTKIQLNVRDIPSGIYIIRCIQGNNTYSSKFVKN